MKKNLKFPIVLAFVLLFTLSTYAQKKRSGIVKRYEYSFLANNGIFQSIYDSTKKTSNQERVPPFEIREQDAIVIKLKDINPFIYSVNLAVLQGDQISNEVLTERNSSKELNLELQPIQNILVDQKIGLNMVSNLKTRNAKRAIDSIQSLISTMHAPKKYINDIELEEKELSNLNEILLNKAKISVALSQENFKSDSIKRLRRAIAVKMNLSAKNLNEIKEKMKSSDIEKNHIALSISSINTKEGIQSNQITDTTKNEEQIEILRKGLDLLLTERKSLETQASQTQKSNDLYKESYSKTQAIITTLVSDSVEVLEAYQNVDARIAQLVDEMKKSEGEVEKIPEFRNSRNKSIKESKKQLALLKSLESDLFKATENLIKNQDSASKESIIIENLQNLQFEMEKLNKLIEFHNELITIVHLPENSFNKLNERIDLTLENMLGIKREELTSYCQTRYDSILTILIKSNTLMNELYNNIPSNSAGNDSQNLKYDLVVARLNSIKSSVSNFNRTQLMRQIMFMMSMISEENFEVPPIKVFSFEENADFVRYHVELKPNAIANIPQGKSLEPLDFTVLITGGIKFDVSSGFVVDLGLKDPSYFFDAKKSDSVYVKKNGDDNLTPSIATFLNGYKRASSNVKLGGAFGIGLSNNARFRIYLGPSVILGRKERVVITAGISFGAISRLGNGYKEGMGIVKSSALPTEVPTILDKFQLGGYFGIGFNLTGRKNQAFLQNLKFK